MVPPIVLKQEDIVLDDTLSRLWASHPTAEAPTALFTEAIWLAFEELLRRL